MPGFTNAYSAAVLDREFPTTGATDWIGYSTNGTSETANLARTQVPASGGWAAATVADPSVKANAVQIDTAAVTTAQIVVTHFAPFTASTGGTQKADWTALSASKTIAVGDSGRWAIGALAITLT